MLSTQHQCHNNVAMGCCPASRKFTAAARSAGKGFGCRVPILDCLGSSVPSRCSLQQSTRQVPPHGTFSHRFAGRGADCNSLGETVCHGVLNPHFQGMESDLDWSQGFSIFPLLPLAAVALAFSRAMSLMVSLSNEVQNNVRNVGTRNTRHASVVEEFTKAAKGRSPWRPGLEKALMQQGGISLALLSATAIAQDHLNPMISTLRANPTIMSGLIAWAMAQVAKVFTYYVVVRKWDFRMVMGSGGMPSSHSALCFALTTSVAFVHGVSDALFPVCLGFTLIVMYDAAGVRRHAGKQAEVLNMIVEDLFKGHPISERKLKELLGHTPLQVFAGAALGVIVGYFCSRPTLV
ncbi:unnamed protein product [Calypogeia fissa]